MIVSDLQTSKLVQGMFENRSHWFRPKRIGKGIEPTHIKGWFYLLGWTVTILAPGIFMLRVRKPIFGLIWLSGLTVALWVDSWLILRKIRKSKGS